MGGNGDLDLVNVATQIMRKATAGSWRAENTPYESHPLAVAKIVEHELGLGSATAIALALLHDVFEFMPPSDVVEMSKAVGRGLVAEIESITWDHQIERRPRVEEDHRRYFAKLASASDVSMAVKLADRIHNLRTLCDLPRDHATRFIQSLKADYLPLARLRRSDPVAAAVGSLERELSEMEGDSKSSERHRLYGV